MSTNRNPSAVGCDVETAARMWVTEQKENVNYDILIDLIPNAKKTEAEGHLDAADAHLSNPQTKDEEKSGHAILNSPLSTPRRLTLPTSPVAPYSASKQELKEAAIALTWLAESMIGTGNNAVASPIAITKEQGHKSGSGLSRGRRAASRRCSTVIQEAIMAERELGKELALSPKNYITVASDRQARRVSRPNSLSLESTAFQKQKQTKGYSMNSRVGRAMMAILEYIEVHQSEYVGKGVPERILRQEFGNNPDTSKALRFLVSEKKIIRAGLGGRRDPFSYTMADPVAEEDGKTEAKKENKQQERVTVGEEREEKDENYEVLHPCSGTPANGTFAVEACAAAAALAAPSTGKWLSPDPILRRETARHRVQHPRLSLSMGDGKLAGKETDITMADVSLQARKRSAPLQTPPPSHLKDLASKKPALEICSASAVNVNNASTPSRIAHNSESQDQQQMLPTSTGPWGSWPTQLPISQRLSASTKPPSASLEPSTATKTGTLFLTERAGATEAVAQQASQQATQAFFLQLRAAQLFWQHRQLTAGGEISVTQEGSLQQPNTENAYSYPH